jgi:hypothetical protein
MVNMTCLLAALYCGDPGQVTNASLHGGGRFEYGDRVTYTCHNCLVLPDGKKTLSRLCDADGQWTGSLPVCQSKDSRSSMLMLLVITKAGIKWLVYYYLTTIYCFSCLLYCPQQSYGWTNSSLWHDRAFFMPEWLQTYWSTNSTMFGKGPVVIINTIL